MSYESLHCQTYVSRNFVFQSFDEAFDWTAVRILGLLLYFFLKISDGLEIIFSNKKTYLEEYFSAWTI